MAKTVKIEYKDSWLDISVPDTTRIIQYGTPAFPEIPIHPNPEKAVKKALDNPVGMERISGLVKSGNKVAIAFDDPIRMNNPETKSILISAVVEELLKAGVKEEDITLLCANGTHCKCRPSELRAVLGSELYERFRPYAWREGRLLNHDCTQDNVYLGETNLGIEVEHNKAVVEADQLIYVGTVSPLHVGGYSGQGVAVGLASTRTMKCLHSYDLVRTTRQHGHFEPEKSLYRGHKLAVHEQIENVTGKKIFYVDAITGPEQKIVDVFAGHVPDLEKIEYPEADRYFVVKVPQADIVIIGLPHRPKMSEDTSDNPGMACFSAAFPLRTCRNKPLLRENGVLIVLGQCTGVISPRRPADLEALRLYRSCFDVKDFFDHYMDAICNNPEYLYKYRYEYAYSPIHSFWMTANIDTLHKVAKHTIFAGEVNPGVIRDMGAIPARNFDEALAQAMEIVGKGADILVLPSYDHDPSAIFEVI